MSNAQIAKLRTPYIESELAVLDDFARVVRNRIDSEVRSIPEFLRVHEITFSRTTLHRILGGAPVSKAAYLMLNQKLLIDATEVMKLGLDSACGWHKGQPTKRQLRLALAPAAATGEANPTPHPPPPVGGLREAIRAEIRNAISEEIKAALADVFGKK